MPGVAPRPLKVWLLLVGLSASELPKTSPSGTKGAWTGSLMPTGSALTLLAEVKPPLIEKLRWEKRRRPEAPPKMLWLKSLRSLATATPHQAKTDKSGAKKGKAGWFRYRGGADSAIRAAGSRQPGLGIG